MSTINQNETKNLVSITKKNGIINIIPLSNIATKELNEFNILLNALYGESFLNIAKQYSDKIHNEVISILEAFNKINNIEIEEEIIKNQINLIEWILKDKLIPEKIVLGLNVINVGFSQIIDNAVEV